MLICHNREVNFSSGQNNSRIISSMAGDAVASSTPGDSLRPVLKGRHASFMKRHLMIGIGFALVSVYAAKILVNDKRKVAYAEFYKNYDIEADFNRKRNLGLFESCGPDDE